MSTANLAIPQLVAGQASPEVTLNQGSNILDGVCQLKIADRDLATPPGSPTTGAVYLVATSPTGLWTSHAGDLALYYAGWYFVTPKVGFLAWVVDETTMILYNGTTWESIGTGNVRSGSLSSNTYTPSGVHTNEIIPALTANLTIANPTIAGTRQGQILCLDFSVTSGSPTYTFGSVYSFGTDITVGDMPNASGVKFEMGFRYNAAAAKYRACALARGF
jgi:hypothetical protein